MNTESSSGATALLGMDGFVVLAMTKEEGEVFVSVEVKDDSRGMFEQWRPCYGTWALGHRGA